MRQSLNLALKSDTISLLLSKFCWYDPHDHLQIQYLANPMLLIKEISGSLSCILCCEVLKFKFILEDF